jgi:hypothetical protein
MDDLEFRKRAHSDPFDDAADFTAAVASNPQRARLIEQLQALDDEVGRVLHAVSIPDMAARLKALGAADTDPAADMDTAASKGTAGSVPLPRTANRSGRRYFAIAASLLVAVAITLSLNPASGPSAQDMEFHDQLLSHLYDEEPRYDQSSAVSWQQVNQTFADAGGHMKDAEMTKALPVKFAKICGLDHKGRGAHIVLEGTKGSVSVFLVRGSSVSSEFQVKDKRFAGRIVPMGDGNLVIVGEKEESLDDYQRLITENFEWDV